MGSLVPIQKGRKLVEQQIFAEAAQKVRVFGVELLDIRFKRINYNESVRPKIYDRMISERRQIAERFLRPACSNIGYVPSANATGRSGPDMLGFANVVARRQSTPLPPLAPRFSSCESPASGTG